ncbi:helix-turn-helix transcriptional regulator [Pedobacter sp. MC2016-15]|jgi:transcriptional regulator with XRE-family HTH domain|uniref:helix-turn-helix domain-containing protein n=1 Tax=Pedobacter sp. MC2016-15 TaxID=2994473 RepID=UPI00224642BE|nr:helix-turn-helix transcriptional regulator [Pedobacter sp. MC2016-15]MCX2480722.1 helix-turn-helix transcriptional regulator [Pedobacter sp. MC2016-15]
MSILSDNLRYLRALRNSSQQKIADSLIISRARYSKYEEALSEPPLVILKRLSEFFEVSIDMLITVDLRQTSLQEREVTYRNRVGQRVL